MFDPVCTARSVSNDMPTLRWVPDESRLLAEMEIQIFNR